MNSNGAIRAFSLVAALVCTSAALIGSQLSQLNPIAGTEFDVSNGRCWTEECWRVVYPSDAGGYPAPPYIDFPLIAIAFSPDVTRIVASLEGGSVRQWDADTGAPIGGPLLIGSNQPNGTNRSADDALFPSDPVQKLTVAYSPDGTRIVAGSVSGTVWQWNAEDGTPIGIGLPSTAWMQSPNTFAFVDAMIMSVAYSPDGKRILAGTSDGEVIRLDAVTGETISDPLSIPASWFDLPFRTDSNPAVTSLAYSPDGHEILAATAGGMVFRWEAKTSNPIPDLRNRGLFTVTSVAYNPDGTAIVTGLEDDTVLQWDAATGANSAIDFLGDTQVPTITFNPLNTTDARSESTRHVTSVTYSPDGTRITAGTANGTVWRLDAAIGLSGGTLLGSLNSVLSVAYTPDGTHVFAVDYDGSVRVWRVASVWPPLSLILLWIAVGINLVVCLATWWKAPSSSTPKQDELAPALKSDTPIQDLEDASPAQKDIIERISAFVRNPDASAPLTFAITGKWGTGKSSLMRLIQEDLRQFNAPCVWFNAWHHQNETHLFASLMESIRRDALTPNPRSFRQFASNLDFRLNLVRVRLHDRRVAVLASGLLLIALLIALVWSLSSAIQAFWTSTSDFCFLTSSSVTVLGSFASFITLLVSRFNPIKAFVVTPASLLQTSRRWIQIPRFGDHLSFRDQFGRAFGEVCSALGACRLVIIIDDLDRCRPDQVVAILEAVNFLTSNGECFVFLGIDEHQVNHAVGLHYSDIAEQMRIHKQASIDDGANGERKPETSSVMSDAELMAARQSYARHYLRKLVNIRIPVPVTDADIPRGIAEGTP